MAYIESAIVTTKHTASIATNVPMSTIAFSFRTLLICQNLHQIVFKSQSIDLLSSKIKTVSDEFLLPQFRFCGAPPRSRTGRPESHSPSNCCVYQFRQWCIVGKCCGINTAGMFPAHLQLDVHIVAVFIAQLLYSYCLSKSYLLG